MLPAIFCARVNYGRHIMATIKRKKQKTKIELPKLKMPGFGTFLFALVFIYILIRVVAYVNDSDPIIFTVEYVRY